MQKKFFVTTAIAYTSSKPHIGNTYEAIMTDALARFKRRQGYDVMFQTGTDEHGQKIEDKARLAGKTPKEYVDALAAEIKGGLDLMNVSYDKFVRTTDACHEKQIQKICPKRQIKSLFSLHNASHFPSNFPFSIALRILLFSCARCPTKTKRQAGR